MSKPSVVNRNQLKRAVRNDKDSIKDIASFLDASQEAVGSALIREFKKTIVAPRKKSAKKTYSFTPNKVPPMRLIEIHHFQEAIQNGAKNIQEVGVYLGRRPSLLEQRLVALGFQDIYDFARVYNLSARLEDPKLTEATLISAILEGDQVLEDARKRLGVSASALRIFLDQGGYRNLQDFATRHNLQLAPRKSRLSVTEDSIAEALRQGANSFQQVGKMLNVSPSLISKSLAGWGYASSKRSSGLEKFALAKNIPFEPPKVRLTEEDMADAVRNGANTIEKLAQALGASRTRAYYFLTIDLGYPSVQALAEANNIPFTKPKGGKTKRPNPAVSSTAVGLGVGATSTVALDYVLAKTTDYSEKKRNYVSGGSVTALSVATYAHNKREEALWSAAGSLTAMLITSYLRRNS